MATKTEKAPNDNMPEEVVEAWGKALDEEQPVSVILNGVYTIENTVTGQHRTLRIKTQKPNAKFLPGIRIVSLLRGPDNTRDYTQFAFVDDKGIKVWHKKRGSPANPSEYEKLAKILWAMGSSQNPPGKQELEKRGLTLHLEKRCIRCNRPLTRPDSIKAGVGPICAGRQ